MPCRKSPNDSMYKEDRLTKLILNPMLCQYLRTSGKSFSNNRARRAMIYYLGKKRFYAGIIYCSVTTSTYCS